RGRGRDRPGDPVAGPAPAERPVARAVDRRADFCRVSDSGSGARRGDRGEAGREPPAVPMILGPTGIGKSQAAFEVALALDGEIVVCDSRQVYDRLDIATNKPSAEQMRRVRYHLVGIADPRTAYTVFEFVEAANQAIDDIASRGRLP